MKKGITAILVLLFAAQAFAATFNITRSGAYGASSGFGLSEIVQTPDRVYPGDEVRLSFSVEPLASATMPKVEISVLAPFLSDKISYLLGDLEPGKPKAVIVNFVVPNSTKPGSYYLYAYAVSGIGASAQIAEIPLAVNEPILSNALVASAGMTSGAYAGETADIPIRITNIGHRQADDILVQMQFGSANALTPIGSDRKFIPSLGANESTNVTFKAGVNPLVTSGYYPVSISMNYKVDKQQQPSINQTFGIKVVSKPGLLITAETASATGGGGTTGAGSGSVSALPSLLVTIANVGDTAVRGVYVTAESSGYAFSGASDKFMGTLNLDDSATISLSLVPKAQGGRTTGSVLIRVSYKDSLNAEHVEEKSIDVGQQFGSNGGMNRTTTDHMQDSNQRFGRRQTQFTIFGIDPVMLVGAAIVLGAAFFAYKWKKKQQGGSKAK